MTRSLCLLVGLAWPVSVPAQVTPAAQPPPVQAVPPAEPPAQSALPMTTLRVDVTDMQVAVLVMDHSGKPVNGLTRERFSLKLDRQTPFTPRTVHQAGDEPLTLGVLLDLSGRYRDDNRLVGALASLRDGPFLPHDRLLLFAADCFLDQAKSSTETSAEVRAVAGELLTDPDLHRAPAGATSCAPKLELWDYARRALRVLDAVPGRHALLLLSDGADRGSNTTANTLAHLGNTAATPIYVLPSGTHAHARQELEVVSVLSGGLKLQPERTLTQTFAFLIDLLRKRYIVEFPRPSSDQLGHGDADFDANVLGGHYQVYTSGVKFFVPVHPVAYPTDVTLEQAPKPDEKKPEPAPPIEPAPQSIKPAAPSKPMPLTAFSAVSESDATAGPYP